MQTFDTPAPVSAVVDVPAGHLTFVAADRTDTTVDVRPADASRGRDVKAAEQTAVEYADGVLRVTGPDGRRTFGPSGSVEVTVQLPAGSGVEVTAASAPLRGVGRLGDVVVETAHGDIKLDEAASARLATQAGDVAVGRLTGDGVLSTAKGDLRVDEAVRGTLDLRTQAGDVTVGVASGVTASLDAGTTLGRVRDEITNSGRDVQVAIRATTTLGDVSAHSR
ncbi:DUF4097 family beta strand repeat-containing protein [Isoptericola sp. BMS4]|uniref:DUF4097 family beta strand repeat-containing protein n=1 Tax=Isoptericola sp. BMS4 TaxID=2527875 RepID=UPI0014249D6A|nr:DUF4097 family beta strand repeat-containing protein [Isoptericola sp. BMS4]